MHLLGGLNLNKKILLALSIAVVAIAAVGTVSAFDLGALFGFPADQHVTMDGENFTIPGTMKEELNASVNGTEKDYVVFKNKEYSKRYLNDTNYINLKIYDYNTSDLDDDMVNFMNGTSKDVSGVKGYLYHDDYGYTYTYNKGSKVIAVQSDNEKLIGPVIA